MRIIRHRGRNAVETSHGELGLGFGGVLGERSELRRSNLPRRFERSCIVLKVSIPFETNLLLRVGCAGLPQRCGQCGNKGGKW